MKQVESYKLKVKNHPSNPPLGKGRQQRVKNGFTLIEIVMIIVIASIAIPTLLLLLGQQAKYGVDAEIRVTEINLAQQLMEEIKSKKWDQNSPIPPGAYTTPLAPEEAWDINHSNYNDVDDYNNLYVNSGNADSVSIGGTSYSRDVQVCYVNPPPPNDALNTCVAGPTNYKRISVTVTGPNSQPVEVVTVVTNY